MIPKLHYTLFAVLLIFIVHLGSVAQDVGCGEEWFDSGGKYGVYPNNEYSTTTFCPDNEGEFVTVTFNHVDIQANSNPLAENSCKDFLEIFDGPDTNSPSLGRFCGQESGNGINPSNIEQLLSVGDAFTASNPEGCLTVVFDSDGITNTSGWEAFVSCGPTPNCTPTDFTVETERNCEDLNFDATVSINEPNLAGFPSLIVTAESDGVQLDLVQIPNLSGQSVIIEDLPLDEDVLISVDVSGQYCPSFEVLNLPSIDCPVSLTCGQAFEYSYCFFDSDTATFLYQSPNDEPVEIYFQSGSLESCCDFIRVYDGEDNTGQLLYDGNNGGDLTGLAGTANSGSLYMELDADESISCQSVLYYDSWNYIEWSWIVGCGEFDLPGCTDPEAINFSPQAEANDGSCIYPAVNDEACGAIALECNGPSVTGDFDEATLSDILPVQGCGSPWTPPTGDLWFQFNSDGTSTYLISVEGSQPLIAALYTGDDCGELTLVEECSGSPEEFPGIYEEGIYYILVRPYLGVDSPFTVSLTCVQDAPDNDEPCGATPLVCNEEPVDGSFLAATPTLSDNCFGSGTADVWFTFDSDGETAFRIREVSSSDVIMNVYKADECDGEFEPVYSCVSIVETIEDVFEAGTYFIRLRPRDADTSYRIKLSCVDALENDMACGAIEIDCETGNISGNTTLATHDENCGAIPTVGIWYVFNSDIDGSLRLNTCQDNSSNTDFDTDISVFTGTCDDLTCYASDFGLNECGGAADITVNVNNGITYYVLVHSGFSSEGGPGNFDLEVTCQEMVLDCPGLGNIGDLCDNEGTDNGVINENCECLPATSGLVCEAPIMVESIPYYDTQRNTAAYGDDYDFNDVPPLAPDAVVMGFGFSQNYLDANEVIYQYTPTEDQYINIKIDSVGFATGLFVFTGCPFETTVGSHTEFLGVTREIKTLPVIAGVTYYVAIGTGGGAPQTTPYNLSIVLTEFDCPDLNAFFGDSCDDSDPETYFDTVRDDCSCAGVMGCFNTNFFPGVPFDMSVEPNELIEWSGDGFDYSQVTGVPAGENIEFTIAENKYITVREGAFNGPVIAEGYSVVTVENASGLDLFPHWTNDEDCSGYIGSVQTTVQCVTCVPGCPDGNPFGTPCDDGDDDTINDQITEDCVCAGTPAPTMVCSDYTSSPDLAFGTNQAVITDDIEVSGTLGILTDLNIVVVIDHTWTDQVDVRLTSPSGTTIDLISNQCGNGVNINVLLDDDGPEFVCSTGPNPTLFGAYSPTGNLSDFNGEDFDGTWTIEVEDDAPNSDDGILVSWCIIPTLAGQSSCEDALSITPGPGLTASPILFDASDATASPLGYCDGSTEERADSWFSYEAVSSSMAIGVKGVGDYDAILEVYDACGGNRIKCRNGGEEGDRETVLISNSVIGQEYLYRVYERGGNPLNFNSFRTSVTFFPSADIEQSDCDQGVFTTSDQLTSTIPEFEYAVSSRTWEFTELEAPFNTYEFEISNGSNPNIGLDQFPEIEAGRSYSVRVKPFYLNLGIEGDYGESCTITIVDPSGISISGSNGVVDNIHFTLFPNPNEGNEVYLAFSGLPNVERSVRVRFFDLTGRIVLNKTIQISSQKSQVSLSIDELSSGVYNLGVELKGQTMSKKLFVK